MRNLLAIRVSDDWSIEISIYTALIVGLILAFLALIIKSALTKKFLLKDVIVDGLSIGLGPGNIHLKTDTSDRQIAFQIWVELKTRKVGLPIDFENDIIVEIYDSWYAFFGITRELVKNIPISKLDRAHTRAIADLSVDVLNSGMRPHLTSWQAKFRRWYSQAEKASLDKSPQEIQKEYPEYDDLKADMKTVNDQLIAYRDALDELVRKS